MWIKYSYVCNDCDALTEITRNQDGFVWLEVK